MCDDLTFAWCERVVREDVSREEVGQEELRIRCDADGVWRKHRHDLRAIQPVPQRSSHVVVGLIHRSGFGERDDEKHRLAHHSSSQGAVAVDGVE
eukprot:10183351-Prorocentrum_lima.AAC.1